MSPTTAQQQQHHLRSPKRPKKLKLKMKTILQFIFFLAMVASLMQFHYMSKVENAEKRKNSNINDDKPTTTKTKNKNQIRKSDIINKSNKNDDRDKKPPTPKATIKNKNSNNNAGGNKDEKNPSSKSSSSSSTNVVIGLMVSDEERYWDSLQAQADTWLKQIPSERVFVVGPNNQKEFTSRKNLPRLVPIRCIDRDIYCKRLQHMSEAYKLLKSGVEFDWLLSGNEDWYVHMPELNKSLSKYNPNEPVVYTQIGCGQHWEYHENSKGGKVPKPPGWPSWRQCDALSRRGGVCGGSGIIMSRAAVEILMKNGEDALFELTQSQPFDWPEHPQGDLVLSCLFYALEDQGLQLHDIVWKFKATFQQISGREESDIKKNGKDAVHFATVHAVVEKERNAAQIIRYVHNLIYPNGDDEIIPKKVAPPPPPPKTTTTTGGDGISSKIIVGLMVSNKQRYWDALQAMAETWLPYIPKERVFVVGPKNDDEYSKRPTLPRLVPVKFNDRDIWWKRLQQVSESYRLMKEEGLSFDWLLSGNEDWYVDLVELNKGLKKRNPNDPVIYAGVGCGQAWEYHKGSEGNTKPAPAGWRDVPRCEELRKRGGVCGGNGIILSRAAVEILMGDGGEDGLFKLTNSLPGFKFEEHPQGDDVLSCLFYALENKGLRLETGFWRFTPYNDIKKDVETNKKLSPFATVHAVVQPDRNAAEIIRDVHSWMQEYRPNIENKKPIAAAAASEGGGSATRALAELPGASIIVGLMVSDQKRYWESLKAQADTWLRDVPESRVFVVGPKNDNELQSQNNLPRLVPIKFLDRDIWWKRVQQMSEAHRLSKNGVPYDWLLSGNEDWYIDISEMSKALQKQNPNEPVVYTGIGCGQAWEYHENSKGGTVPKPPGWPNNKQCDALNKRGGVCGGDGIILSRAAVDMLMANGEEALFKLTESLPFEFEKHPQGDLVLSCLFYAFDDQGMRLQAPFWSRRYPPQITKDKENKKVVKFATLHAIVQKDAGAAEIIRDLHSWLHQT